MVKWFAAAAVVTVGFSLALMLLVFAAPTASQASASLVGGPSVLALNGIPPAYLALYMAAAQTCPRASCCGARRAAPALRPVRGPK